MLTLLLALAAHADPPDRVVAAFDTGAVSLGPLAVSDDGGLVVASHPGGVWIVDTETWTSTAWEECEAGGAGVQERELGGYTVWVACGDGSVAELDVADGVAEEVEGSSWAFDEVGDVLGAAWEPIGQRFYVVSTPAGGGGGAPRVHVVVPEQGTIDPSGYPVTLLRSGFVDVVNTGSRLVIAHGGDDVSTLTHGATAPGTNTQPWPYNVNDLAPSIRDSAYAADNNGLVLEYQPGAASWLILANEIGDAHAVGASTWVEDEWLLVARRDRVDAYALSNGSLAGATAVESFDPGGTWDDVVVAREGYALATRGGEVVVATANPWVDAVSASPAAATDGDLVTIAFSVDVDASWELRLGSAAGALLASGEATPGAVSAELTVDSSWAEGENRVVIVVRDGEGRVGTAGAIVVVDNPPVAPALTADSLGFANGALVLTVPASGVADLVRYDVYVTVAEFDPAAFATGGPPFDGDDALVSPVAAAITPGQPTEVRIAPLTNGVTYYIAARAVDAGGLEGPMSAVVSGSPRPSFSASQLNGEEGGMACATLGFAGLGLPWVLAAALTRRRRAAALASLGIGLALVPAAWAELPEDETDAWWNVEIHYGTANLADEGLRSTYGVSGHDLLRGEYGVQIKRFFEIDFGVGYLQDVATTVDSTGAPSGEESRYTVIPLALDATLRLHVLDEQPVVPFARIGLDYALWNEKWTVGEAEDRTRGAKAGWHYAVGGQVLLDTFARGRASRLEATTGINDTWITVEWRKLAVDPGRFLLFQNSAGTTLSSSVLTVGLKLDY